jgi:hypothetical protein
VAGSGQANTRIGPCDDNGFHGTKIQKTPGLPKKLAAPLAVFCSFSVSYPTFPTVRRGSRQVVPHHENNIATFHKKATNASMGLCTGHMKNHERKQPFCQKVAVIREDQGNSWLSSSILGDSV